MIVPGRTFAHGGRPAEVGITQSRTGAGADRMVRDQLALDLDADPASFAVEIRPVH